MESVLRVGRALVSASAAFAVLLAVLLMTVCAYNIYFHPLSKVPGPKLAAISNIWLAYHARNGRLAHLGRTLHGQYGPAVRVGPNEVWFNSKAAFKAIYSAGSGYEKSDFYLATVLSRPHIDWMLQPHAVDTLDLLSERDMRRYRSQRRLIGPVYRPTNIIQYEGLVDKVVEDAISKIKSLQGAEIDLKEWMHIIVVEALGAVVLSWSPGMLQRGTDHGTSAHSYRSWRRKSVFGLFPTMAKLDMCSGTLGRAFSLLWKVNFKTPPDFRPFFPIVGRRIGRRLKAARLGRGEHTDLAADLIRVHQEKEDFTEAYLRKMIMTNFGAGHETMASTLTSIMALVGTHPDVQARLAEELRQGPTTSSYASAGGFPYLQAIIKESKRLWPVIAAALPRETPVSGLHIHDIHVPAGTTVGCSPVALHRNEYICGSKSHEFEPERWLEDGDKAKDMELFSLAWGGGARTCPGRHLAEMIVWKVTRALLREFEVKAQMPPEEDMPSYFLSMMTGVKARFVPR